MSEFEKTDVNLAPETITKKDVRNAWFRFYFADEIPHSFDKYIAPALMWSLMPILKKLYKNKEDLAEAYQRHLLFFNTQISWGGGILTESWLHWKQPEQKKCMKKHRLPLMMI